MKKIKTIGLIAPCGCIKNKDEINKKISILENSFKIKKFYNESACENYLSDTDEKRAEYFLSAFSDNEVDLVLAIRGGYGALRIVDRINFEEIKNSDKFFAGSSDATILLCALYKKTKVKCFHSLMVSNGFVENLSENIDIIEKDTFNIPLEAIKKGDAEGILWGGNLSSLVTLFSGENYLPDNDIILFLEDLNEPLYKIDKMLYEIYRNKKLKEKIKGIIFGDFYIDKKEISPLLEEYSLRFDTPSYLCSRITHKKTNITIPFGKFIRLCDI